MMDLFATALKAAGISAPADRVIDGDDIMPLFTKDALSPHAYIFEQQGARIAAVRDARWKLHVLAPNDPFLKPDVPGEEWVDPRAPDGVTIIAPYEQYKPSDYPGVRTGDKPAPMMLFDLVNDGNEQHNVAAEHADIVARLKGAYDEFNREVLAVQSNSVSH
jgi:arylsulfatase A-like enzyme